jgi:hypothetical protein
MSLSLLFGEFGSVIGDNLFGEIGSSLGMSLGNMLGKELQSAIFNKGSTHREKGKKDDFDQEFNVYAQNIPLLFGKAKISGQIIWASRISDNIQYSSKKKGYVWHQ